jgi:hypothetical protein
MWSNKAYTAMFFNTNAKGWAVVYYGFFSFGVNCVAFGIAIFTYWICVYKPEMAEKDKQLLLQKQALVESQFNQRRRPGLVRSIRESIDYRAWTSDDYRRANPPSENYMTGHGTFPFLWFQPVVEQRLSRLNWSVALLFGRCIGMSAARSAQEDERLRREMESLATM